MPDKQTIHDNTARWLGDQPGEIQPDVLLDSLDQLLAAGPDETRTDMAQSRLWEKLEDAGDEVIYYDCLPSTPVGPLYLAASQEGLVALSYSDSELAFIEWLKNYTGAEVRRDVGRLAEAVQQVRQYLAGERLQFVLPLDLRFMTSFQRRVLTTVARVPAGQVTTYGDLARRIQRPQSARAVGQALGHNPIPIVLPCHRVLAADGNLGGYSGRGGIETKRYLLTLEGVDLDAGQLPLF
ncbi:MAG: methylated-DNA--[protein]-cysteine S-methyltransferase [Anaerolineales bacterium]|jgi:methylated-DNA-[protein]-cysteine S-methyltransferase